MVSEREIELAIVATDPYSRADERLAMNAAGIDYPVVLSYGERFLQVKDAAGAPRAVAVVGAFLLAFRLGVLAARNERAEL